LPSDESVRLHLDDRKLLAMIPEPEFENIPDIRAFTAAVGSSPSCKFSDFRQYVIHGRQQSSETFAFLSG
jgi:hypothetical protein